jgi:LacI family transcriptional regulator
VPVGIRARPCPQRRPRSKTQYEKLCRVSQQNGQRRRNGRTLTLGFGMLPFTFRQRDQRTLSERNRFFLPKNVNGNIRATMSVTIRDIAQAAGVSHQTVSRALNGSSSIRAETRQQVMEVAQRLSYRPNRLAGSLRRKKTGVIGLVVSDIENQFFAEIISGAESEASARGYSLILANSGEEMERERQAVKSLLSLQVDGIVISPAEGDQSYLTTERPEGFPIVAINRPINSVGCDAVLSQNDIGAKLATEYLIGRGHRNIGAIVSSAHLVTSRERLAGFRAALKGAKLPIEKRWIGYGGTRTESARRAMQAILASTIRPTAMFSSNSKVAEGIMAALYENGLKHRDIEIASFDDVAWARFVDPPMGIVTQQPNEMGRKAVRILLDSIAGQVRSPTVHRLPVQLSTHGA